MKEIVRIKLETEKICQTCWLKVINRYKGETQEIPNKIVTWSPEMRRIICLYTYARYSADTSYEQLADDLLSEVFHQTTIPALVGAERSLSSLGCGLLYLLRNGFAVGCEDEILSDIDKCLSMRCFSWKDDSTESLYGCIHYFWLRIRKANPKDWTERVLTNKINLICYLDYLKFVDFSEVHNELISDLKDIHQSGLCPSLTEKLLAPVENNYYQGDLIEEDLVTFIFPVRIDSLERERNLDVVLSILAKRKNTNIIVLEADVISRYRIKSCYQNVDYYYVHDKDPVFYRTKYLNDLLCKARTSIVGVWDTDVIILDKQIREAIAILKKGKAVVSFPYDGRFYNLSLNESALYRDNPSGLFLKECMDNIVSFATNGVGGAFFVNRDAYLKAGGENKHFYGWGVEDLERVRRMEILDMPVCRVAGPLFHLYHPRSENSGFHFNSLVMNNQKEFIQICRMTKVELIKYVGT